MPTLTNETTTITTDQMWANYTLNLTDCTGTTAANCMITSNPLNGSLIPPVRSARLVSRGKKFVRYGRVEVVAKMPKGDWLWPAICELLSADAAIYHNCCRSGSDIFSRDDARRLGIRKYIYIPSVVHDFSLNSGSLSNVFLEACWTCLASTQGWSISDQGCRIFL